VYSICTHEMSYVTSEFCNVTSVKTESAFRINSYNQSSCSYLTCVTNECGPMEYVKLWVKVPLVLLLWGKISSSYSKKLSLHFLSLLVADCRWLIGRHGRRYIHTVSTNYALLGHSCLSMGTPMRWTTEDWWQR
jgi:hypothetical protein